MSILSERIKETRIKRGLQQDEIAESIGITRGAYSTYETGKASPPPERLSQLADVLKVSVDYLLGRTDAPYEMYANLDGLTGEENQKRKEFIIKVETLLREAGATDEAKLDSGYHFFEYLFSKNNKNGNK